ncbi:CHAD domain-containing protein [Paraburkholderia silvatlantica]|uniref:CHAD domain-containing protein n=1 Tax=Paraburkholderia silvatlantica TaxID=321895 RepID=A0ABR6FV68_9BURK|nr:CHAD domain-containing protein [Paraburkholderia silvatlantica]MBB2931332.1 CHAD domain-containing protein [Paraburkholderia silvatlantica]PVY28234.1 CHAD domain-containing protein [Paraburkholderia silvatlantica]PXW34919.1 CHAD domain-containing protein [Paraburkholderia silvatlantica]TDQ98826.1 CHAD domain-containing protein [Paraburkholderia silvatlantica]
MDRVLEIVLDVVIPAAPDRKSAKAAATMATASRAHASPKPSQQAASLCAVLPPLVAQPEARQRVTTVVFDRGGVLGRLGWRVAVESHGGTQHVVVSSRRVHTPGVTVIAPIFEAALDANGIAHALFDAAPEPFREALGSADDLAASATLVATRSRWQWPRDGIDVLLTFDEDLHEPSAAPQEPAAQDARGADAAPPPDLHELRVSAPWPEGEDERPIVDALFACAGDLVGALPAFVRLTDALDRASAGSVTGDAEAIKAEAVDLGGAATAEAALVAIGRNISAQWFGNDTGARDSKNGEFIHQMRVSQRRLRTAMRIFSRWCDETWETRIEPELKWLGGLLGDARDRDVFVESTLPALAAADVEPGRWDAIRDAANAQRLAARARLREALASQRYARAALAWLQWLDLLARRAHDAGSAGFSLHRHAKRRVRRYYERLASTQKLTAIDEASRHRARINAKYLRYTIEFFATLTSRRTRVEVARALARLQSVLGDGNDAAVALRYLERMDAEPYQLGFARGWCEAVKRYTAKEGERLLRELGEPKVPRGA